MAEKRKSYRNLGGRPTALTEELMFNFVKYLNIPLHLEVAAAMVGMHRETVADWLKRGAREWQRLSKLGPKAKPKESEAIYMEFHRRVSEALAKTEAILVGRVTQKSPEWVLARRFAQRWGNGHSELNQIQPQGVADEIEGTVEVDRLEDEPEDRLAQLIAEQIRLRGDTEPTAGN